MDKILSHCAKVRTARGTIYYDEISPSELYHQHDGLRQRWAESLLDQGDQLLKVWTEWHSQ